MNHIDDSLIAKVLQNEHKRQLNSYHFGRAQAKLTPAEIHELWKAKQYKNLPPAERKAIRERVKAKREAKC